MIPKINYNFKSMLLLTKESVEVIKTKLNDYESQLVQIFGNSQIELVFHSSILERKHPIFGNLEIYFAVLNSLLHYKLKQITRAGNITNRNGFPIKFQFLNVAEQFHKDSNIFDRPKELSSGYLTHRSNKALENLTKIYNKKINKLKTSKFLKGGGSSS